MTPHEVTSQWWDHSTLWNADDPHLGSAGHTTDGGRAFGITRTRYVECDDYACKPVAVVAYEDREQVERLIDAYVDVMTADGRSNDTRGAVLKMQDALREFANPTPSKPDEPSGLGAVVATEADGDYIRVSAELANPWLGVQSGKQCHWDGVDAVTILSEGLVTP